LAWCADIGSRSKQGRGFGGRLMILGFKTHFDRGTLYGEQWYPIRVDRAYHGVAVDEMGCSIFGQLNGVKVHKMRWLGSASVDKEYRSMVVWMIYFASTRHLWRIIRCKREVFVVYGLQNGDRIGKTIFTE
jgi:hypothetical protein